MASMARSSRASRTTASATDRLRSQPKATRGKVRALMTTIYKASQHFRASFRRALGALASDDRGQATLEYILILSASVVGAAAISRTIIGALDRGILHLGAELEKDLRTGRVPVDAW